MPDGGIGGRVRAKLPRHVMPLKTIPFGPPSAVHRGSDVAGVIFSGKYLLVQVACDTDATGLVHGFHVLEVSAGGWSDEEDQLQGFTTSRREWLVVTGNGCVSVFAHAEPQVHAVTWQCDEDQV